MAAASPTNPTANTPFQLPSDDLVASDKAMGEEALLDMLTNEAREALALKTNGKIADKVDLVWQRALLALDLRNNDHDKALHFQGKMTSVAAGEKTNKTLQIFLPSSYDALVATSDFLGKLNLRSLITQRANAAGERSAVVLAEASTGQSNLESAGGPDVAAAAAPSSPPHAASAEGRGDGTTSADSASGEGAKSFAAIRADGETARNVGGGANIGVAAPASVSTTTTRAPQTNDGGRGDVAAAVATTVTTTTQSSDGGSGTAAPSALPPKAASASSTSGSDGDEANAAGVGDGVTADAGASASGGGGGGGGRVSPPPAPPSPSFFSRVTSWFSQAWSSFSSGLSWFFSFEWLGRGNA